MANAALALTFSDHIERWTGMIPSEEEKKELDDALPKITRV